jgi:cytochrome c oxidase assembly factor CtaG
MIAMRILIRDRDEMTNLVRHIVFLLGAMMLIVTACGVIELLLNYINVSKRKE